MFMKSLFRACLSPSLFMVVRRRSSALASDDPLVCQKGHERLTYSLAWDDPKMQALYQTYARERSMPFFRAVVEQGKAAGAIRNELSFEAIVAYIHMFQQLLSQPDFLTTASAYQAGLDKLLFFGLLGKEPI
jgi:hypothetical protein